MPSNLPIQGDKSNYLLQTRGDYWTIYVKDNGKGIPKDLQTHLLKSDEYITTYGTHNEKGSGLGLILCRDFIRMNKGKLHFCSQEGIGTTFYFTIPKASSFCKSRKPLIHFQRPHASVAA